MPRGKTVLAASLVALVALLVGFQGASTLLTVTQLGASPDDGTKPSPRAHASLVPRPPLPAVKPSEPAENKSSQPAAPALPREAQPAAPVTADLRPIVPDEQADAMPASIAQQSEFEPEGERVEQPRPQQERRRRYRAPRVELHKVY